MSGIKGDGAGHTITLLDAYDNPSFVNSTDPSLDSSASHIFDQTAGLPDLPTFTRVNQNGQTAPLAPASQLFGWSFEIALDIEWAHAMAPAVGLRPSLLATQLTWKLCCLTAEWLPIPSTA